MSRKDVDFFIREKITKTKMQAHEHRGQYPPSFQVFLASSHKDPTLQGGRIEFTGAERDLVYDLYLDPPDTTAASHPSTSKIRFCILLLFHSCYYSTNSCPRKPITWYVQHTSLFREIKILYMSYFRNRRP